LFFCVFALAADQQGRPVTRVRPPVRPPLGSNNPRPAIRVMRADR
jgi:hypothetical protein